MPVSKRALTPEQKRIVVERLYSSWLALPELRLGQLLENGNKANAAPLFYVEDFVLADAVDAYARKGNG